MQVGDKVRVRSGTYAGLEAKIIGINGIYFTLPGQLNFNAADLEKTGGCSGGSLGEIHKLAFKKEPEKSFIKAGITDTSDALTQDGRILFLGWLLEQNKEAFKKEVVDPILEEMKKNE